MGNLTVLIIDDDRQYAKTLSDLAGGRFEAKLAFSGEQGLKMLDSFMPDAVLLDLRLGRGMNGIEVLGNIKCIYPDIPVLIMTQHESVETAVEAIRRGAADYLQKSMGLDEIHTKLEIQLEKAARQAVAEAGTATEYGEIVGKSAALEEVREHVRKVASMPSNVLILGETGVGKEVVARQIHKQSQRCGGLFVGVNVNAIAPNLFESELFGHVKGAFTGATSDKRGMLALADGGTLFLDEIGKLELDLQGKLHYAVEHKQFKRVGSEQPTRSDFRLVCASNCDLKEMVEKGEFMVDLYYRLQVYPIRIPPLRERPEDIPVLAHHILSYMAPRLGREVRRISSLALRKLSAYTWQGNVRELKTTIERAVIYCEGDVLEAEHILLDAPINHEQPQRVQFDDLKYKEAEALALTSFRREYFEALLQTNGKNVTEVCRAAGISRSTFYRYAREAGLSIDLPQGV